MSVSYHPTLFPPIPEDTAEIVGALFGQENIYIRLGNQINRILLDVAKTGLESPANRSEAIYYFYALVTSVQYAEGLTDLQSAEAVSKRVDLKYALHLPLYTPSFDPGQLCKFRRQLYHDPNRQQLFQALLCRLEEIGLLEVTQERSLNVTAVLEAVCTSNRLEIVLDAVFQILEALAVNNSEWLRQITLPHWYERFSRRGRVVDNPTQNVRWKAIAPRIGQDIQYLLAEIERVEISSISSLKEVQNLRRVEEDQFEQIIDPESGQQSVQFRAVSCASCDAKTGEVNNNFYFRNMPL